MYCIDFHTHIMPDYIPDYEKEFGYSGFITLEDTENGKIMKNGNCKFRQVKCNCYDSKIRLADCKKNYIRKQVLSTVPVLFNYWAKPEHTNITSHFFNYHIASVISENPDKYFGLCTLPMNSIDLAIIELERCMKITGFIGAEIGTHVNGKNYDDPIFLPFFQKVEELGAILFIHPWDMAEPQRTSKYWMQWLVAMPFETSIAINSFIFGGVYDKFPKLKTVFAHGGGSFIGTLGRIQKGYDCGDRTLFPNKCSPKDYLKYIYVDSLVHDEDMLLKLVKELGSEHVLYGTDYPFPLGESYDENLVDMSHLSYQDKVNILYGNICKLISD